SYPLKGSENTREGAATVAQSWIVATDYFMFTGDSKPLEHLTDPQYPAYQAILNGKNLQKQDGRLFGKPCSVQFDTQELIDGDTFDTQFLVHQNERVIERVKGKAAKIPAVDAYMKIRTKYVGSQWKVVAVVAEEK
ncbi:MAG: DUF6318 family protein, partial [Actinomycetaceae bacterium]|nr:DUF6318 family protein [Actinomycetaceae bacterium]